MIPRMDNPINGYLLRDKRGNLLPGGRLEFFDSATDIAEVVYDAGSNQTVSLGSVIYADAYGLLPDFELTPNQEYLVRCYDADDVFQWERDGIANNVSDLEDRVEALESSVAALGEASGLKNLLTNGGCKAIRQFPASTTFDVRSDFALGELAGIYARVTNATAGTFIRNFDSAFGSTGVHAQLDDVTTDNSGAVAEIQWRMPSGDGAAISGDDIVFSVKASQNSGAAMNAYVTLYKCLTRDDYSSLVTVATSATVSLESGVTDTLELAVDGPGDLSTGVAIVVTFDCGIVSNTNFIAGEAQLERGQNATVFEGRPQLLDQAAWATEDLEGVGEVKWFPATSAPPGTLMCGDVGLLSRADYPRLWAWAQAYSRVVAEATWATDRGCFSSGDGSTTFRIPDYITDEAFFRAHDPSGSRALGEIQQHQLEDHEHAVWSPLHGGQYAKVIDTGPSSVDTPTEDTLSDAGSSGPNTDQNLTARDIYSGNHGSETRPTNYSLLPCIKY